MFAADEGGTAAWQVGSRTLQKEWRNGTGGTSPFEAGGLLFVYDPGEGFRAVFAGGGLNVYDATSGKRIARLPCGRGHWNSPIVVDARIILPEGNANSRATSGVLDVWTLPTKGHSAADRKSKAAPRRLSRERNPGVGDRAGN
jgi:hypothetical protein